MRHRFTPRFQCAYAAAPPEVRKAFDKRLGQLLEDFRHSALQTHPVPGRPGYYQGRATLQWRFYYYIEDDTYVLTDLFKHKD
jgi:hypothetical protein